MKSNFVNEHSSVGKLGKGFADTVFIRNAERCFDEYHSEINTLPVHFSFLMYVCLSGTMNVCRSFYPFNVQTYIYKLSRFLSSPLQFNYLLTF